MMNPQLISQIPVDEIHSNRRDLPHSIDTNDQSRLYANMKKPSFLGGLPGTLLLELAVERNVLLCELSITIIILNSEPHIFLIAGRENSYQAPKINFYASCIAFSNLTLHKICRY